MAKKALVILAEGFEETEAITCIDILRRAGIETTSAGLNSIDVKSSRGIIVRADKKLEESDTDFDACVLPGGMPGAANLAASKTVLKIIHAMNNAKKLIAAICAAPAVVLAPEGLLNNKSATCFPGMEKAFGPGIHFKKDSVVIDGSIITSRALGTALPFALAITEQLVGRDTREKIEKAVLYHTD